jgi:hypothetical protein
MQPGAARAIENAKAILLRRELHQDNAMIEFNLACYASVTGRFEVTVQGHQMKTLKFRMMVLRFLL